jgi:hypothetical protein
MHCPLNTPGYHLPELLYFHEHAPLIHAHNTCQAVMTYKFACLHIKFACILSSTSQHTLRDICPAVMSNKLHCLDQDCMHTIKSCSIQLHIMCQAVMTNIISCLHQKCLPAMRFANKSCDRERGSTLRSHSCVRKLQTAFFRPGVLWPPAAIQHNPISVHKTYESHPNFAHTSFAHLHLLTHTSLGKLKGLMRLTEAH